MHRSLQREVDHLISVAITLINTKYFVVIAVNCNPFNSKVHLAFGVHNSN